MRKLWLIFAQSATVTLAVVFVLSLVRPDLNPLRSQVVPVTEAPSRNAALSSDRQGVQSLSKAARKAMPSVVNISTSKDVSVPAYPFLEDPSLRRFFDERLKGQRQKQYSLGSGVIVSPKGYILTNHHVIEAADEILIAFSDGRSAAAKVVGADPETDLAVLRVKLDNLPAITFGRAEQVRVGDFVLAIGDPFGVGQTVTMGIISATGRSRLGINTFENFIQTDAPINPGNSGGALVDTNGDLLGINTAIVSKSGGSQGIGFSIPVSLARNVMDQLIRTGSVTRGWIGVEVQDLTPALAESFKAFEKRGALVADTVRGGPAERAAVRPGDLLVAVNGQPVSDSASMLNLIAELQPGQEATLNVLREKQELALKVTVGRRPKPQ
jgi:serine protease DegQ